MTAAVHTPPFPHALVRTFPALGGLTPTDLGRLVSFSRTLRAEPGVRLFEGGRPALALPLLLEGVVRVKRVRADGREVLLYRLRPGECCPTSAAALLGDEALPADGVAETVVTGLAVPREACAALVAAVPAFRAFVLGAISRGMGRLLARVEELAFLRVDQRLASRLLLEDAPLTATHQALADDLGTSREVVSRILAAFQAAGAVRLGRRRIELLDREALHRIRSAT